MMKAINHTRKTCLAHSVIMADSFFPRLKGLLGKPRLNPGWCLVLKPCKSVHTVLMRFSIDVLFLDRHGRALRLISHMPPFRLSGIVRDSHLAVELPAGTLAASGTKVGDIIKLTEE